MNQVRGDLSYIASFWQDIYSFGDVAEQLRQIGQNPQSKHMRFWGLLLFLFLNLDIAK